MSRRRGYCWLVALTAFSCVRPPLLAPSPAGIRAIAVNNRTGDPLLVAGASFFENYVVRTDRITVPDVLAAEARFQLARRGFAVSAPEAVAAATGDHPPANPQEAAAVAARNNFDASVLYIDLRRWEADAPFRPQFVIVSLAVLLIEPSTGQVLWRADHPSRPVPTKGVVSLGDAYTIAARAVMQEMLTGLGPEQPGP